MFIKRYTVPTSLVRNRISFNKQSPDSSYYFLQRSLQLDSTNEMRRISFAETLLMRDQYDSALKIFLKPLEDFRKGNDKWDLMRVLMDAAKAYSQKGNNKIALSYALETYSIAKQAGAKQFILEGTCCFLNFINT